MPYRTLLAFAIKPDKDYRTIAEVGAFAFTRTPTLPAKLLLKREVEQAHDLLAEDRGWKFDPNDAGKLMPAENSVRIDEDEMRGYKYDKVYRYVFFYDKHGNIVAADGAGSRDEAATQTKYDEAYFKRMNRRRNP